MKTFIISLMLIYSGVIFAQKQTTELFLDSINIYVSAIERNDTIDKILLENSNIVIDSFHYKYLKQYKDKMTDHQIKIYSQYRSRYYKAITTSKAENVSNKVDSMGNKIADDINVKAAEIIGTIKGIFSKKK